MTGARPADILRHLEEPATTDHELLARFVREQDHAAFRELVVRHGPVVLGVCRRVTGHREEAEDAFQAAFLTLARKASSIGKPEALSSWLHGVALRVAQTARRSVLRRRSREAVVSVMPDLPTSTRAEDPGFNPILDEELEALPPWYRDAIVLCDLQGLTREQAATTLGVPEGTLSSRLAMGRKKLALRLTKRGITLSVAAIPMTFSATLAAPVPNELVTKTCVQVADWMAGGTIPKPLAKLTEGGMAVRKFHVLGLCTVAATFAGVVYAIQPKQNTPATEPANAAVAAVKTALTESRSPDSATDDKPVAGTYMPRLRETIDVNCSGLQKFAWNQQGTQLALQSDNDKGRITVVSLDPLTTREFTPDPTSGLVGFMPDGKQLITEIHEYELVSGIHRLDFWGVPEQKKVQVAGPDGPLASVNPLTIQKLRSLNLDLAETQGFWRVPYAIMPDGKSFRTVGVTQDADHLNKVKVEVLEVDLLTGKKTKSLLSVTANSIGSSFALSPDGKKLAVFEKRDTLLFYDVDSAAKMHSIQIESPMPNARIASARPVDQSVTHHLNFSRDNSRLVVSGGIGLCLVLNANSGTLLAPLQSIENCSYGNAHEVFSGDDRLLALWGMQYSIRKAIDSNGQEQDNLSDGNLILASWDTQTGKALKTWQLRKQVQFAFNPVRPVLAILESNRSGGTRIGLWDFSPELTDKK
jgi:RNA polymerase sigma factor (sigma-70 family)